jgi:hypothetical protein
MNFWFHKKWEFLTAWAIVSLQGLCSMDLVNIKSLTYVTWWICFNNIKITSRLSILLWIMWTRYGVKSPDTVASMRIDSESPHLEVVWLMFTSQGSSSSGPAPCPSWNYKNKGNIFKNKMTPKFFQTAQWIFSSNNSVIIFLKAAYRTKNWQHKI